VFDNVVAGNVISSNKVTFEPVDGVFALPMNIRAAVAVVDPDALKRILCTKLPDGLAVNTVTAPDPLASKLGFDATKDDVAHCISPTPE
jgi:hypothetical protein